MQAGSGYSVKAIHYQKSPINYKIMAADSFFNHLPFSSFHPGGANFLLADGRVHFLPQTIDMATYVALGTCDGGEVAAQVP
jgi:prepilin-type processing-associated H-X9-DG protein